MSDTPPFEIVRLQLRALGLTIEGSSELGYRVNFENYAEITAHYTHDLQDALETGRAMHAATIEFRAH
jgi:hypothetical protein